MDLRSLWRRRGGQPDAGRDAAGAAGAAGADELHGAEPIAAVERPSRPAWRDLAPIPPTVRAHPLVAPTVSFSHALSGHRPAPLALETLGHDRPADAPAGVVTGLFVGRSPHTPVQDESGGTSRAVVRGPSPRPTGTSDAAPPGPPRLAGASTPAVGAGPARPAGGLGSSASASPALAPAHRPVVARSVAGTTGGTGAGMTTAPATPSTPPAGMIGRPAVAGSPATLPKPIAAEAASPASAPVTPSISIAATPLEAGPSVAGTVARRNLGQTRRLRIGPAIGPGALDDGPSPDRQPADRSDASGRSPSGPDALRDLAVGGGRPGHDAATAGSNSAAAGPSASSPAVARSIGPDASRPPDGPDAPAAPTDVRRAAAPPGSAARPVPARPVAAGRPIERAPLVGRLEVTRSSRGRANSDGSAAHGRATSREAAPGPRSTVQDALAALGGGPAIPTGDHGGARGGATDIPGAGRSPAAIQRSTTEGSWLATAGEAGWSAEAGIAPSFGAAGGAGATTPTVARSVGGSARGASTPAGLATGSWSTPIRQLHATAAGARHADGQPRAGGAATQTAVGTIVARAVAPSPAAGGSPAPTIWRSETASDDDGSAGPGSDDSAGAGPLGTIQRLEAGETVFAPRPAATASAPTVLRAAEGGEGGGGGAAATGQSDKELDELARKLFPRLQLRLRGELLIDRERVGALVDLGR